ncbi:MAG: DUF2304 domain-containing protein [Planctomycetes bacterium]|nr:DUF2304 domain-containing protein [Planctomycetota bacterium]
MTITDRQRVVALVTAVTLVLMIFELVRRRRLREEYSWLWFLAAACVVVLALWDWLLGIVMRLIGAGLPVSALLFVAVLFLTLICIQYAVRISALSVQVKNLAQQVAILVSRLDDKNEEKK